jgi:hypothetical protein
VSIRRNTLVACKFTPKVSFRLCSVEVRPFRDGRYLDTLNLSDPLPDVLVATLTCAAAEEHRSSLIGCVIKHDLNKWVILEKTANKRGRTS